MKFTPSDGVALTALMLQSSRCLFLLLFFPIYGLSVSLVFSILSMKCVLSYAIR
jgi:hypothetical protein